MEDFRNYEEFKQRKIEEYKKYSPGSYEIYGGRFPDVPMVWFQYSLENPDEYLRKNIRSGIFKKSPYKFNSITKSEKERLRTEKINYVLKRNFEEFLDDIILLEDIAKVLRKNFPIFVVEEFSDDILYNYFIDSYIINSYLKKIIKEKVFKYAEIIVEEMKYFFENDKRNITKDDILYCVMNFYKLNFNLHGLYNMDIRFLLLDRPDSITDTSPRDVIIEMIEEYYDETLRITQIFPDNKLTY